MTLATAQNLMARFNARLSGSRAYGMPRQDSDWDYWMCKRNVKRLAKYLTTNGWHWDSPFLGSLWFYTDQGELIEVSYLFPKTKKEHDKGADVFAKR